MAWVNGLNCEMPLCPAGLAASLHIMLMIAPSGKVFSGYDSFLALYGENGREAMEYISIE